MISRLLLLTLTAAMLGSAEAPKPECNAKSHGMFWPDAANSDRAVMRRAADCGELEMCSLGLWRYRWTPLTVRANSPCTAMPGNQSSHVGSSINDSGKDLGKDSTHSAGAAKSE
jgi:hypothetical protein